MTSSNSIDYRKEMNEALQPMTTRIHYDECQPSAFHHLCVICGSKAIGMNFGALTCAPCKAFFRRNARRTEILELPCRHRELNALIGDTIYLNERAMRYLQIRRCSSCRLRRCFEMNMKAELVRTDEENERYRQLVEMNRQQRQLLNEQVQEIKELSIPRYLMNNMDLSQEIDWCHLSNLIYAYDSCCIETFIQQRSAIVFNKTRQISDGKPINKHPTTLTMSIVVAVSSFLKALPAYYSLPRSTRNYLSKTNIRPLIFPSVYELNQSCFSEPWQEAEYQATWQVMCGPQLYKQFDQAEKLAENLWIADPIVTRLFVVILFFSSPLHYHDDCPTPTSILRKTLTINRVQNAYITLLWKYLLYRHDFMESVRIYCNLIHVYMKMHHVGYGIYTHLRTQQDLVSTHETLNRLVTLDINDVEL